MIPESGEPAAHPPPKGAAESGAALASAVLSYLQGWAGLLGIEVKEAAVHYLVLAGLVIGAVLLLGFGYILALLFVAFGLAALLDVRWVWVTLGLCLLHLLGAAALLLVVKVRARRAMFSATGGMIREEVARLRGEEET